MTVSCLFYAPFISVRFVFSVALCCLGRLLSFGVLFLWQGKAFPLFSRGGFLFFCLLALPQFSLASKVTISPPPLGARLVLFWTHTHVILQFLGQHCFPRDVKRQLAKAQTRLFCPFVSPSVTRAE